MINFNLTKPQLKPEIIGKAIKEIVPLSKISMAIEQTLSAQKRKRILPNMNSKPILMDVKPLNISLILSELIWGYSLR